MLTKDTQLEGRYHIKDIIGQGGMGVVYQAEHIALGSTVAIKTINAELIDCNVTVERFHREAKLAAAIGHPNICGATDFGTTEDNIPYFVMPLLKGQSLKEYLEQKTITPLITIEIITQVLQALEAAHQKSIIHRDIKPANIFISSHSDEKPFVHILDFGISKATSHTDMELTQTGSLTGTVYYMAPEQIEGKKNLDAKVDIYATGIVLYEMLTGQKPFDGESYNQVLAKILQDPVTNPMDLNPHIPKTLEQVILKAIARPPEHRYQSAKEMQIALESIIADDHPCPTASKKINLEEDSTVGTWTQSSPFVKNTSPKVHIVQPDRNAPTDSITATAPAKKNRSAHSRKLWILGMLCLILIGVIWVIFPQFRPSSSAPIKKEIEEKAANVSADSKTSTATNAVKLDPVDKQTTVDTADKPIAPKTHSSSTTSTGDTEAAQPSEFPTETNKTATSNTPSKDAKNADKATKKNKRRKKNRNKKNKTETNLKHPIKGRFDTVFATEYE